MNQLRRWRTELWHLRQGGLSQLRLHRERVKSSGRQLRRRRGSAERQSQRGRVVPDWPLPEREPRRDLCVGVILDDFSELALRWEWQQIQLIPTTWREQVADSQLDMLFVESAWNGNKGAWQYQLTGSKAPSPALRELVAWCRGRDIPTVFWNKEDPVHYEDFIDAARLFDHVVTTDAASIGRYLVDLGHENVGVMPFAAAAWIHNPMRPAGPPDRDIAFAGMYFAHKYPERREQMGLLLGAADEASRYMNTGLEIFSRFLGKGENYQFPPPLDQRVVGSLTYEQMLSAYRDFSGFINVSSVPDSETMCPRRVFEISACGTPVVTTPTPAISRVFAEDEVLHVRDPQDAVLVMRALVNNREWRDRVGVRAARKVLREHTYRHRVDDVLRQVGLDRAVSLQPTVSVLVSTNRPQQLTHVLETVASQREVAPQLVILAHGHEHRPDVVRQAAARGIDNVVLLHAPNDVPLGECLNRCLDAADGDVVTKMDDDDFYGPDYLADQLRALDFSGAQVVGKHAHFVHLVEQDMLLLRFPELENYFTHFVMGPTLMMPADVARTFRFSPVWRGEDTDLLRRLVADQGRVYATDRFGFVQVRHSKGHTWRLGMGELLATGTLVVQGAGTQHAVV